MSNYLFNDVEKAKEILSNINWGFYPTYSSTQKKDYSFNCRKYHWYPATYIPEIPFTLIEVLTNQCAKIYDPFGGCGTTYFQALLLNRIPYTTEISKVSTIYMKSLFTLFNPHIEHKRILDEINGMISNFAEDVDYITQIPANENVEYLGKWYSKNTFNKLVFLFILENKCTDITTKAALSISISALLKMFSSQDRGWGCIADNVLPKIQQIKDKDVFGIFKRHLQKLISDVSNHVSNSTVEYEKIYTYLKEKPTIFNEDVRTCTMIQDESIDLVVTSPPYPNMTDYITSQRLSYYFYGFNLDEDKALEIGARHKRSRKSAITDYLKDMDSANENISSKLKKGGYACFVMPSFSTDNENNIERKRAVKNVMNSLEKYDLIPEGEFERKIPSKRRSHNMKWTTLNNETIYFYRKA